MLQRPLHLRSSPLLPERLPPNEEEESSDSDDDVQDEEVFRQENWGELPAEPSEWQTNASSKKRRRPAISLRNLADLNGRSKQQTPSVVFDDYDVDNIGPLAGRSRRATDADATKRHNYSEWKGRHKSCEAEAYQQRSRPQSTYSIPPANPGGQIRVGREPGMPPNFNHRTPSSDSFWASNSHNFPMNDPSVHSDFSNKPYHQPTYHTTYPTSYPPSYHQSYPPRHHASASASYPSTSYLHPDTSQNGHPYLYNPQFHSLHTNGLPSPRYQQRRAEKNPSSLERQVERIEMALENVLSSQQRNAIQMEKRQRKREEREIAMRRREAMEREKEAAEQETMARMERQVLQKLRGDLGFHVQAGSLDQVRPREQVADYDAGSLSPLEKQVPLELFLEKGRRSGSILEEFAELADLKRRLEGRRLIQGEAGRGGSAVGSNAYDIRLTTSSPSGTTHDSTSAREIETIVYQCLERILASSREQAADLEDLSQGRHPPTSRDWPDEAARMNNRMKADYARASSGNQMYPESSQLAHQQRDPLHPLTSCSIPKSRTRRKEHKANQNTQWKRNPRQKLKRTDSGYESVYTGSGSRVRKGPNSNQAFARAESVADQDEEPYSKLPLRESRPFQHVSSQESLRPGSSSSESGGAEVFPRRPPAPYAYKKPAVRPEAPYPPVNMKLDQLNKKGL